MTQLVQAIGSLLILAPFALAQAGRMPTDKIPYLALNAVGSTALAVDAGVTQQWGFLLLESVWALVSVIGLIRQAQLRTRSLRRAAPRSQRHEGQGVS